MTELERLFRDDGARLWRALFAFCGSGEIADEARAEAFAQAVRRWRQEPVPRSTAGWVWTTAFKIARGLLKDAHRQLDGPDQVLITEIPPPVDHLVKALACLSPRQRQAVVLFDYADRPIAEVASSLGVKSATAYVHINRGRRRLRQLLDEGTQEVQDEVS